MFKRILTFVLAGVLVLETPAAAYAAEQGIGIVDTGDMANSNVSDTADGTDNVSDSDGAGSTDNGGDTENTGDTDDTGKSDNAEGDDGTDQTGADHGADSDNGTGDTDNGSDDDHGGDSENGDDVENADGSTGENKEPDDSPENDNGTDKDDTDHNDTGNDDIEDNDTENDNTENDNTESGNTEYDDTEGSDSVSENDISISENDSSVSQNTLYAASKDAAAATADSTITEISYEEATGNGVAVQAPAGRDNAAWYSFTAPRAGRYAFYTDNRDCEGTGTIYVNLCKKANANTKSRTTYFEPGETSSIIYHYLWVCTDYMKQGETVYLQTYVNGSEDRTYTVKVSDQREIAADENGARSLVLDNGDRITLKARAGCERIQFDAEVTYADPKDKARYYVRPYWGPADHSTGDLNTDQYWVDLDNSIYLGGNYKDSGKLTAGKLTPGKAYDISYVVLDSSRQFKALLSGMEYTTLDRKGEEWLYIHDQSYDDHSVTLEIEPLSRQGAGDRDIYCFYAPTDGSETEKSVKIDQWEQYKFIGLRSGTEYTFVFRTNTWSEPIKTLTFQTTGTPVEISVSDYEAVVSEDFSTLSVSAKTDYAGNAEARLCCNFKDEVKSYTWRERAIKSEEAEGPGFRLDYGFVYVTGMVFLPDKDYEMEIWVDFPDEGIAMEPQVITFHTPADAVCNEEDIVLEVTQDSNTKTTVHCKIDLPMVNQYTGAGSCHVWYRPLGKPRYSEGSTYLSGYEAVTEDGKVRRYKGELQIEKLQPNVEYEFLLYLGGVIKRATLNLNESGLSLARVENAASDHVGPYEFTHTYQLSGAQEELTGEYYVQLQHVRADNWSATRGDDQYTNVGSAVPVNETMEYQLTYSAAQQWDGWRIPGAEYNLRWLVGREQKVTKDNAVCCLYENVTMAQASPLKIEEKGYMRYQVTMDAQDVAVMKSHNRSTELGCYVRKEGTADYVACPNTLKFNAGNDYSAELRSLDLALDSSYEMYIGNSSGTKYAEGVFSVSDDKQALKIDSVVPTVSAVKFHYTIENADPAKLPYIVLYTRKKGSTVWSRKTADGAENGTIVVYDLQVKTEYEYKIGIGGLNASIEELRSLQEGRFTTMAEIKNIDILSVRPRMESAFINCALGGIKEAGEEDIWKYVICFYRPVTKGENKPGWKRGGSVRIYDQTRLECKITGLTKETVYEYQVGYGGSSNDSRSSLVCVKQGTFTTTGDLRNTAVTVTPGMYRAQLDCIYNNVEDSSYLHLFIQEDKAETDWQKIEAKKVQESGNGSVVTYMLEGLKEHTSYRYRVGFGKDADMEPAALVKVSDGTFSTWQDTRGVEIKAETKVSSVKIVYTLSGMEHADEGYLCGFLRETSVGDAAGGGDGSNDLWNRQFAEPVDRRSTGGSLQIGKLQEDTEYELLTGFGDREGSEADQLKCAETITFRTLPDNRKLSEAKAEVKSASVTLSVLFDGNTDFTSSYVSFFYRVKEETEYRKAGYITNVSNMENGVCSATLTGLERGTAYEYTAVLSGTRDEVQDPDSVLRAGWKASGEFETPAPETPDSVALSQEKLCLNASEIYKKQRGYGYEDLKITWSPENITKDFLWESSDPEVAAVSKDGRVSAVAPGTAQITVTSKYNPETADTCQIVVGKYQMGHVDGEGNVSLVDATAFNAVKGQCYGGYGLYDLASGTPVAVTEVKVTSDNEAAVSWNAGEITARQTGLAHLVFEAPDGVRAVMAIDVQTVPGRGFDIVGFEAGSSKYPAVREEEKDGGRVQYTLACKSGLTYTAIGEIMPESIPFVNSDFTWSIDNTDVAEVNEAGVITPKAAGKAVLLVTPKETVQEGGAPYLKQTCEVTLLVKELPSEQLVDAAPVYALANISKKIGDVQMPKEEAWEGWRWEEPNTPLVINGVNRAFYPFRAVYTGEEYYPEEKTVKVYIARVTGVSVTENAGDGSGHNKVIETSTLDAEGNPDQASDRLTLTVESKGYGAVNYAEETNYFYDMDIIAPASVIVQKGEMHTVNGMPCRDVTIAAVKPGTYTVTAVIKVKDRNNSNEKTLAKAAYKVKAVAGKQAYVTLLTETTGSVVLEDGRVVIDSTADTKTFQVQAKLTDINGQEQEAFEKVKLAWSITDKKVAAVKPSKDTHSVQITVKGEGHAILKAKVKDAAGHTGTLQVEIRNNAPRVSTEKVTVNLAYDYDTEAGRNLARASSGMVEIVPVYGEPISNVILYNENQETVCSDLLLISETTKTNRRLLIRDSKSTKPGVYNCYLCVSTAVKDYFYPLQVTVKDEQAKVTVKSNRAANLFYRSEPASVDISVPKSTAQIASVAWEADAADTDHGFGTLPIEYAGNDKTKKAGSVQRYYFKQGDIQLTDKMKPADPAILSGSIKVKLKGYKEPNEGVKVTLKWSYKKPVIITKQASVTLIPTMTDKSTGRFDLYNQTEQRQLFYHEDSQAASNPKYIYSELSCDNENITFLPNSNTLGWRRYTYTGSKAKGSEKLNLTIRNSDWREPLTAVHTVKLAAPTASLSEKQLTVNTNRIGTAFTEIRLKNAYDAVFSCDTVMVEGGSRKAQALLSQDLLEIRQDSSRKDRIMVKINRAETMEQQPVANGTYPYKITPCYTDASGNTVKMKPLTLKVKVINKKITAKVKTSGSLDLTKEAGNNSSNYISIKTTFQNIGSNYTLKDYGNIRLLGEYTDYFDLRLLTGRQGEYRLRIKQAGKLKAGQRYKLAIRFTIEMEDGDTFTVQSQTFTVTPKQSAPKIKVYDNNQILYASADALKRTYELEVAAEGGYQIASVSGSLDCNKDGKPDIVVKHNKSNASRVGITVSVTDRDGVLTVTGKRGKTYTIPVTVQLKGRDGIAKDVKTNIKVTVKR